MSVEHIYLLPQSILIDVDKLIKNDFVKINTLYNMIKSRFKGKIKFSKKDLKEYVEQRKKEINATVLDEAITPLPIKSNSVLNITQDNFLDKAEAINVRNKAQILEYFKKKILNRIKLIEKQQGDDIDPYLETLLINWTKEMHTIIEKEIKLQLEIEENSKLEKIINERLSLIFLIIKDILYNNIDKEICEKILLQINEAFEIYDINEGLK